MIHELAFGLHFRHGAERTVPCPEDSGFKAQIPKTQTRSPNIGALIIAYIIYAAPYYSYSILGPKTLF